jgi:hypothetical protein
MKPLIFASAALLMLLAVGMPLAAGSPGQGPGSDRVTERGYDGQGRLLWERGVRSDNDGIGFERFYHYAEDGSGAKVGGASGAALTDCPSTRYSLAGWSWAAPYSAYASDYASVFDAAGNTWDNRTAADVFGTVTAGVHGTAGTLDGVNQISFVGLGASTTIAVTTTWYNRASHQAVESDGQYNTYYAWATSGAPGAMDVQDIATHEIGHTFGLNHPKGGGISCLTMYAYANYGETQKRTLGDGDLLGLRAIYGA